MQINSKFIPVFTKSLILCIIVVQFWTCAPETAHGHMRSATSNPYEIEFGDDYTAAVKFLTEHKSQIDSITSRFSVDKKKATAIVFPELIRYALIQDFLETSWLEVIYVESGSAYADFSVGLFQMKPSFAEQLEQVAASDSLLNLKYAEIRFDTKTSDTKASRKIRIGRLKSTDYQLIYLCLFCDIVNNKFGTESDSVSFCASAYNLGFRRTREEIHAQSARKTFPFGNKPGSNLFSYAELSDFYSKNVYHTIFNE